MGNPLGCSPEMGRHGGRPHGSLQIILIKGGLTAVPRQAIIEPISRMWRNWQTRRLQVPVGLRPCRFDSYHPHWSRTCEVRGTIFLS